MEQTITQYESIIKKCEDIFAKKLKDYGTSWRILRISSVTDQIFIKAQRIRSIDQKGTQKIKEDISNEYIGIINYSIIGLIQLELEVAEHAEDLSFSTAMGLFSQYSNQAKQLMSEDRKSVV